MAHGFDDDPHSQQGTVCPRNFFGLTDYAALSERESFYVGKRVIELQRQKPSGNFDTHCLRNIHLYLFQDVFPWAGELRVVRLSKVGGAPFASPRFIPRSLLSLFAELQRENCLKGLRIEPFAERAGYYWGELNAIHPFREGNGRTQREFLRQLGAHCGHKVSWATLQEADNRAASILAHVKKDYSWLGRLMLAAIRKKITP